MDHLASIKNGKCSNCNHKIVRRYKHDNDMIYYAINIVKSDKHTFGICGNCKAIVSLPQKMFTVKYIVRKIIKEVKNAVDNEVEAGKESG